MGSTETSLRGRYKLFGEIAAGGMATVHLGRLVGPVGFARTVAIKKLHPQYAKDPEFVAMFLDEARLAARIRHPNVVQTLDVVSEDEEVFLVMDYVQGETVSRIMRELRARLEAVPLPIANSIITSALMGLHAAHEAKTDRGKPLEIVHRDVSPQNIMVGIDGVTRVLDFGVAKAAWRVQTTRDGQIKGKLSYMAPEQLQNHEIDRRVDLYAVGICLWEALTGQRLVTADNPGLLMMQVLQGDVAPPSRWTPSLPPEIDRIVLKALSKAREGRYSTAREMCVDLERAAPVATAREVGEWLEGIAGEALHSRAVRVSEIESQSSAGSHPPPPHEIMTTVPEAWAPEPKPLVKREFTDVGSVSSAAMSSPVLPELPVSEVSAAGVPQPTGTGRTVLVAAAGIIGVGLILGAVVILTSSKRATARPSAAASTTTARTATATESATEAPTAPATASATSIATATATTTATATATTTATATATATAAATTTATAKPWRPTPTKPAGCDPPYIIDAKGIKVPKPQCF